MKNRAAPRNRHEAAPFTGIRRSPVLAALGCLLTGRGAAQTQPPSPDSLPAEPPLGGLFWTWIVPVLLFAVALFATVALYRRFSRERPVASRDGTAT